MSFKFDYKELEKRGYEISDDGSCIRVFAGEDAEPILQRETLNKIYADMQSTTRIDCAQAENLVGKFLTELHHAHIWKLAVTNEDLEAC